jgi:hypothetical protein
MLAIFGVISGKPSENYSSAVYAQVSAFGLVFVYNKVTQLVSMRLLTQVSVSNMLDAVRLKCNVEIEYITQLAQTVGFDLSRYLFDT